jgi:hypothetical protein
MSLLCWISSISDWLESHNGAITAIGTLFIAAFTWRLWVSTNRLWIEAKDSSDTAKKSADAAKESADIAKKSAALAETDLVIGRRAYMSIDHCFSLPIPRGSSINPQAWEFGIVWKNIGQGFARNIRAKCSIDIVNRGITELSCFETMKIDDCAPFSMVPGGTFRSLTTNNFPIEKWKTFTDGIIEVYICGLIHYEDAFGNHEPRFTQICTKVIIDPEVREHNLGYEHYTKYWKAE